jgi:hypothetical protein
MLNALKHWVLDLAHPLPRTLDVFAGWPGSVERAVVLRVASVVGDGITLRWQTTGEGFDEDLLLQHPVVWPHADAHEGGVGHTGMLAVCRYLGRLWRLYPTDPANALAIDSALDLLQRFCGAARHADEALLPVLRAFLRALEDRMELHDSVWLEAMGCASLADLCWAAAYEWACVKTRSSPLEAAGEDETVEFPRLAAWWRACCEAEEEGKDGESAVVVAKAR